MLGRVLASLPAVLVLAVAGACDEGPASPEVRTAASLAGAAVKMTPTVATLDEKFRDLATKIPGFGGFFFDENGALTVYLTRTEELASAINTIRVEMSDEDAVQVSNVIAKPAQFDFIQLSEWQSALNPLLSRPGVVFTDIDETKNVVMIGVEDHGTLLTVQDEIHALGVPESAVKVESVGAVIPGSHLTLSSRIRPVKGGLMIHHERYGASPRSCTMGFNVRFPWDNINDYFFTNAHCSKFQGTADYAFYYQAAPPDRIGYEVLDPPYTTGGDCPSGRRCRWSDAAAVVYDQRALSDYRSIARTTSRAQNLGSKVIDDSKPRFDVIGRNFYPFSGQSMNKVGVSTGWTYGTVSSTCVRINDDTGPFTYFCQYFASAGFQPGDSGSPVFSWNGGDWATIQGIAWARTSQSNQMVFSPVGGMDRDFGPFVVN